MFDKKTWATGDLIEAEELNRMEQGIEDGILSAQFNPAFVWNETGYTASAAITDGAPGSPLTHCIVKLVPAQSGTGQASRSNVRPITGHVSVTIGITSGGTTEQKTFPLDSDVTPVYAGTYDCVTGELTITHQAVVFKGTESISVATYKNYKRFYCTAFPVNSSASGSGYCSHYKVDAAPLNNNDVNEAMTARANNKTLYWRDDAVSTTADMKAYFAAQYQNGTPVVFVAPLAATVAVQCDPAEIDLPGVETTISSDQGMVNVSYCANTKDYVEEALDAQSVLVDQILSAGKEIGGVTVGSQRTALYAPLAYSSQIMPIYIGDFLSGEAETNFPGTYPGCCVKIGDYIYAFCGGGSETNTGLIRRFDLVNNVEDRSWAKTALVGHANSCAYDSNTGTVYVVPLRDYSVTPSVSVNYIYAYNASDFSYIGTVSTPTSVQAVTFDPVAKKLYYYGYHSRIYVRDTNSVDGWTVICWVKTDNLTLAPRPNGHTFDQDFAAYNGRYYLSSAQGNVCTGLIYGANPSIPETGWTIAKLDSTARFYLGEPEGWEFTDDGHLIGLNFVEILGNLWDTFVVEYPVGIVPPYAPMIGEADSYHDGTITLSEATQLKFGLWTYEIRSLAQMEIRFLKTNSSVIMIPSDNVVADLYKIRMNDAIKLLINGEYQCEQLAIQHGYVNIHAGMSGAQLTLTTADEDPILLRHASRLAFTGDNRLLVSTPNKPSSWNGTNFISIGYDFPILASRVHPNSVQGLTLRIAGTPILWDIYYMGSYPLYAPKLVYCSKSNYSNNYVTGTDFTDNSNCIITGWHNAQARLNIPVSVPLPSDGTEVFVGRFTCLTSGNHFDSTQTTVVPSQSGTNPPVLITFYNSGYISMKCYGTMTCDSTNKEWYRTVLPALPASGWWTNTNIFN